MTLFECGHLNLDQPLYDQGMILLPHLTSLGLGLGSGNEIISTYPYFVVGVFHAVYGPEVITSDFFGYSWKDKNQMTTILGIHLIILGLGAYLFVLKATMYGGLYDSWSPGGVDTRLISHSTLSPAILFSYLLISPFGGDG